MKTAAWPTAQASGNGRPQITRNTPEEYKGRKNENKLFFVNSISEILDDPLIALHVFGKKCTNSVKFQTAHF